MFALPATPQDQLAQRPRWTTQSSPLRAEVPVPAVFSLSSPGSVSLHLMKGAILKQGLYQYRFVRLRRAGGDMAMIQKFGANVNAHKGEQSPLFVDWRRAGHPWPAPRAPGLSSIVYTVRNHGFRCVGRGLARKPSHIHLGSRSSFLGPNSGKQAGPGFFRFSVFGTKCERGKDESFLPLVPSLFR